MNRFIAVFAVLTFWGQGASAFSAVAVIKGEAKQSLFRSSNFESQKEADLAALEGCRVSARKNGLGKRASECVVATRGKTPGYGTVVCGDDGCAWGAGYGDSQSAVDDVYATCAKSYSNCRDKDIEYWEDFVGFKTRAQPPMRQSNNDCRPRTNTIRCQSSCTNGDCVVSYENGCAMRVQVAPQFNGQSWVYPSPQC